MKRASTYRHEFVRSLPDRLEDGVLYVSMEFDTAGHRCFCGCGKEVYTPLSPRDWKMIYDGETVSMAPSIGNWSFACQSHYWLDQGRVSWAAQWSRDRIAHGRAHDQAAKDAFYKTQKATPVMPSKASPRGTFRKLLDWLFS